MTYNRTLATLLIFLMAMMCAAVFATHLTVEEMGSAEARPELKTEIPN